MNTRFICDKCRKSYSASIRIFPFVCDCGNKVYDFNGVQTYSSAKQEYECVYRGRVIGEMDCNCAGKPKIYDCEIHGKCAIRKLKPGVTDLKFCNACQDISLYKPNDIGFLLTCYNKVGGVETWARTLIDKIFADRVSGIATASRPKSGAKVPVHSSLEAASELLHKSKVTFVWGVINEYLDLLRDLDQPTIAIHHGSLQSTWANETFSKQLDVCTTGIAINEEVAKHFGVQYLPNPVIDHGITSTKRDRTVLWNHRWALEKRPQLVLEIAKLIPTDIKILISAPPDVMLPRNCVNIGLNTNNLDHLRHASVFLSTADQEGFGFSLAEAILAEVPIVAAPLGLAKTFAVESVHSDDPRHWADAIVSAMSPRIDLGANKKRLLDAHGPSAIAAWRDFMTPFLGND